MELALRTSPAYAETAVVPPIRLVLAVLPSGAPSPEDLFGNVEGFVLQQGEAQELLAIVHALAKGAPLSPDRMGPKVTLRVVLNDGPQQDPYGLSPRESDVLRGLVGGLSYKMVADKLGIGFETVRTHVKKIYQKLDVRNCTEAVAKALKSGLVT